MRTSYKKNRPFDFKLIDHVEPNTVLYKRQTGLSNYDVMKVKSEIWSNIAEIMDCDVDFCLMRWNNLHYQYRKESRRPGGSTWPYFKRLQFLSGVPSRPKAKHTAQCTDKSQTAEVRKESSVDQDAWQSYDDCVVMHVSDMEHNADSFIIEEIIEQNDQILQEEIIYEEDDAVEEEHLQPDFEPSSKGTSRSAVEASSPASDYLKMSRILEQLKGNQKVRAERRIMAFVLKCQLRALVDEPIDDLVV
ncbi:uncharacterized protein LOC135434766 [Drosophila montana]|uniref:uncharacterized protein LOC135434766 n=1 Tax=Drosophila montana TaxID=40370 RepID=UPI00313F0C39